METARSEIYTRKTYREVNRFARCQRFPRPSARGGPGAEEPGENRRPHCPDLADARSGEARVPRGAALTRVGKPRVPAPPTARGRPGAPPGCCSDPRPGPRPRSPHRGFPPTPGPGTPTHTQPQVPAPPEPPGLPSTSPRTPVPPHGSPPPIPPRRPRPSPRGCAAPHGARYRPASATPGPAPRLLLAGFAPPLPENYCSQRAPRQARRPPANPERGR